MRKNLTKERNRLAFGNNAVYAALGGKNPLVTDPTKTGKRKDVTEEGDKKQATAGLMAQAPSVKEDIPSEIKELVGGPVQQYLERIARFEAEMVNKDASTKTYTCEAGDTITDICEKTGNTITEIMYHNPDLKDKDGLYGGDQIKVADIGLVMESIPYLDSLWDLAKSTTGSGLASEGAKFYQSTPPYVSQAVKAQMQRLKEGPR